MPKLEESPTSMDGITTAKLLLVGLAGFEPTASSPPVKRATRLRHSPTISLRSGLRSRQDHTVWQVLFPDS